MEGDKIDFTNSFTAWSQDPSPANTGVLLKQLEPTFSQAFSRFADGKNDPLIRSRAKRIAVDAFKTFNPQAGAKLNTHVMNHLKGLRRVARRQTQVLRVPDRAAMDQAYLQRMQAELTDQLGREPTTVELSDYSSFNPNKISRLRKYVPGMAEGSAMDGAEAQPINPFDAGNREMQIMQLVHDELAPVDQSILEWSVGLYGSDQLENRIIAAKLGLTPGAVSQRKRKIQEKINQFNYAPF